MSVSAPEPSAPGVVRSLEAEGLTVTADGGAAIARFASGAAADPSLLDPAALANLLVLLDGLVEEARSRGDVVDSQVVAGTLRRLCPLPPWCG